MTGLKETEPGFYKIRQNDIFAKKCHFFVFKLFLCLVLLNYWKSALSVIDVFNNNASGMSFDVAIVDVFIV